MNKLTFSQIKTNAKNTLKPNYWLSFGVTILFMVIVYAIIAVSTLLLVPAFVISGDNDTTMSVITSGYYSIFITIVSIFILTPLSVGITRFFINQSAGTHKVNDLWFAFKNHFLNVVLITFLKSLYIFLWSLLFIIPGIIKSFEYSMIEYVLAENPSIDRKRAFEITKAMTKGNKWRIFCFGLSFIGWILLSYITFGIGFLFLAPYMMEAFVQLYYDLKAQAIANGAVNTEEFLYE